MYQNENGDYVNVHTYMNEANEKVKQYKTYQSNGWVRVVEYYPDGTITETFEFEVE